MNTIGFFICWVLIGIFAIWKLGDVADKWQKDTFTSEENERYIQNRPTMDGYLELLREGDFKVKTLMVALTSILVILVILTWPLTVAVEFMVRKKFAKGD